MPSLHDHYATAIDGTDVDLAAYRGQVVLVVNTASQCGFTPQYEGLQELQEIDGDRGFCRRSFGVTLPMFSKVDVDSDVNGEQAYPLFRWLREEKGGLLGDKVMWNFTKLLIGGDGRVVMRYPPRTKPEKITGELEKALAS